MAYSLKKTNNIDKYLLRQPRKRRLKLPKSGMKEENHDLS